MNKAQISTIIILAFLWTLGGIRLIWSGSFMLLGNTDLIGFYLLLSVSLALIIGFAKGKFILSKSANRSIERALNLENNLLNCFIGWVKAWGLRGFLIIGLMIAIGLLLGGNYSPFNSLGRGLIRITIGLALLIGSQQFWLKLKDF